MRPIAERTAELATLHAEIFGALFDPADTRGKDNLDAADCLRPVSDVPDDELMARIRASAQGDKFARLWAGDTSLHGNDDSAADLALCMILAFWTQCDAERIDRLFRLSGLMRRKWNRVDYRTRTIAKAIAATVEAYQPPLVAEPDDLFDDVMIVTPDDLREVFE